MFSENTMDLIEEGLYLGSLDAALDLKLLRENNICRVLSILNSFTYFPPYEGIEQMRIEVPDVENAQIIGQVPRGVRFIAESQKTGQNVLVHCAAGISRSASMVIAYIMVKYSVDFETAKSKVKEKRRCISLSSGFERQIGSIDVQAFKQFLD